MLGTLGNKLFPWAKSQGAVVFWLPQTTVSTPTGASFSLQPNPSQHARLYNAFSAGVNSRRDATTHLSAGQYVPCELDLGEVPLADGFEQPVVSDAWLLV